LWVLSPLGLGVAGAVVFGFGFRGARRQRRTYVNGQAAKATVTAIKATAMRVNRQRVMRVEYVFDTIQGQASGKTTSLTPPPVGETFWILYDEADPARSVAA
jgi:hypothetical protein